MFDFQPKINKNTEKLIKDRESRKKQTRDIKSPIRTGPKLNFKASEKILIQKFNKEFDLIRDDIFKQQKSLVLTRSPPKSARGPLRNKSYSSNEGMKSQREMQTVMETETTFTYEMIIYMLVRLGFLPDSKSPPPHEHPLALQIFKILRGSVNKQYQTSFSDLET